MNKGLELIEACWLFDASPEQIQVVVHPQSVIHSMAAYDDGSVIAQLGNPDMRTPIAYGLAWPERIDAGVEALDLFQVARLDFEAPDEARFPCLRLAREAMQAGGAAPAILNAANEVAVEAFFSGKHCVWRDSRARRRCHGAAIPWRGRFFGVRASGGSLGARTGGTYPTSVNRLASANAEQRVVQRSEKWA